MARLKELRIKPIENRITSQEAASILTWRANREYQIDCIYKEGSVRRHVALGNLKDVKRESSRHSFYNIDEVFEIPIKPRHSKQKAIA